MREDQPMESLGWGQTPRTNEKKEHSVPNLTHIHKFRLTHRGSHTHTLWKEQVPEEWRHLPAFHRCARRWQPRSSPCTSSSVALASPHWRRPRAVVCPSSGRGCTATQSAMPGSQARWIL